jgi:hypothetical protein
MPASTLYLPLQLRGAARKDLPAPSTVTPTFTPSITPSPTVTPSPTQPSVAVVRGRVVLGEPGGPGLAGVGIAVGIPVMGPRLQTDENGVYRSDEMQLHRETIVLVPSKPGFHFEPPVAGFLHRGDPGLHVYGEEFVARPGTATPAAGGDVPQSTGTPTVPPCADAFEPDDSADGATRVIVGRGYAARHSICPPGDADFVSFDAFPSTVLRLAARPTRDEHEIQLRLLDVDGETEIPLDGRNPAHWIAPAFGRYFLRLAGANAGVGGPDVTYRLSIELAGHATQEPPIEAPISLPLVLGAVTED